MNIISVSHHCLISLIMNQTCSLLMKQDQDTWLCQTPLLVGVGKEGPTDRPTDRPTKPFVGRPPGSGNYTSEIENPNLLINHLNATIA